MSFTRRNRWRTATLSGVVALAVGAVYLGSALPGSASKGLSASPRGAVAASTHTGTVTGQKATAKTSSKPFVPTKAQQAAHDRAFAQLQALKAPASPRHTTSADVSAQNPGPETVVPKTNVTPNDFKVFKSSQVTAVCPNCGKSTVNEPAVAAVGKHIQQTSNWNLAYSDNNGTSWGYQNPYTLFGSAFCCDQDVVYAPSRNRFFASLLYYGGNGSSSNRLVIANRKPTSQSWCYYTFYPNATGGVIGDLQDFPKIQVGANSLYVTWNEYNSGGSWYQTGLMRLNLDQMTSCGSVGYSYLNRNDVFTFALSTTDTATVNYYWVSNWYISGGTSGSQLTIYTWAENSGTYFAYQRNINPYTFGNTSCPWCGRLDPRYEAVSISHSDFRGFGDAWLEVAISAGPSGLTTRNYVVYEYFYLDSLGYIGNDQTYNTSTDFAYPGCAVNEKGSIGCSMVDGNTSNRPGGLVVLKDDISPGQPWAYCFCLGDGGSTSQSWGDYDLTTAWNPGVGPFITTLWNYDGSTVHPYVTIFGRNRDTQAYNYWKVK
jgi:hypothetical protein